MQVPQPFVLCLQSLNGQPVLDVSSIQFFLETEHFLLEILEMILSSSSAFALVFSHAGEFVYLL